ncbi:hypothetical protein D9M68_912150 [compost metagenome]
MPWLGWAASQSAGVAENGPSHAAVATYHAAISALPRPAHPGRAAPPRAMLMQKVASSSTVPSSPPHRLDIFRYAGKAELL